MTRSVGKLQARIQGKTLLRPESNRIGGEENNVRQPGSIVKPSACDTTSSVRLIRKAGVLAAVFAGSIPQPLRAADFRGRLDVSGVGYPSQDLAEARGRLFAAFETEVGERWFFVASAYADGVAGTSDRGTAGVLRPHETYVEYRRERAEIRFGFSNLGWGVIDELAPQDVVNPVDVSRFVLEDRGEARLPVPLARLRWFLPAETSLEAVLVPWARGGTFDQLDEPSSPFAPAELAALPRSDLPLTPANMEGGLRFRGTTSGLDWGASVYRDIVDFDRYEISSAGLTATRPGRVMVGGDVETARGEWVFRGEGAFFLDDPLQAEGAPVIVTRWSFQGGFGADRRLGENLLFLDALYRLIPEDPLLLAEDEISLIGGLTRDLASGTQNLRVFGVWNPRAGSVFARATWSVELVENLRLELGGGAFLGDDGKLFGLIADSDFAVARLRIYF